MPGISSPTTIRVRAPIAGDEDGIAGIADDKQHVCFALALWNGKDPILKERLFGLTNSEGNHGEDVDDMPLTQRAYYATRIPLQNGFKARDISGGIMSRMILAEGV